MKTAPLPPPTTSDGQPLQLALDFTVVPVPTAPAAGAKLSKIEEAFWSFHSTNPHVYATLVRFAREAMRAGHRKIGIGALYERMRWEIWMTQGDASFKLNNNHRSHYARLMMQHERGFRNLFDLRELRA